MKPWYRSYGWRKNPFFVKPDFHVVGMDKEKNDLVSYVESGVVCFLTGDHGVGKTSLLKWLERNVKKHVPVYIDCENLSGFFDLGEYLKTHKKLWKDLFRRFPKNVVVLLDEAQASEDELKSTLKAYWDSDYVKSVVIVQVENLDNFSKAVRKRIGKRTISINKMPREQVHELIKFRVSKKSPFTEEAIDFIAKISGYIPRTILENCERICIDLSKRGKKKKHITTKDIKSVFDKRQLGEKSKL